MPTIRDLARARVVVVGDAVRDVWIHGRVDRISPEAPVPVFLEDRREERAGGAAHVVSSLRALGCTTGGRFRPIEDQPIKTRYVVNNQQIFRSDYEDCSAIDQATEDAIFLDATSHDRDVLIISDYAKGVCTPSLCQRLIAWAKAKGVKVVVDPKSDDWRKYDGAYVITPNEREWKAPKPIPEANYLITLGADGMNLLGRDRELWAHIPATNSGPVDVTGAGDTVIAVLAAALAVGFDLEQAARLANAAAGVSVSKFGTATCGREELETAMGERAGSLGVSDVPVPCTLKTAPLRPIVGFANGVFDCFHDGHAHFLRECALNCDTLVVAINDHAERAKNPYKIRALAVAHYANSLEFFDSEAELLAIMQRIKPDVIFKGEDYHGKPVTGGDLARIHWVARHPGYSSTIERAKAKA